MLPCGREVILPPLHARFRCAPVLNEKQATTGLEHAAHLCKRTRGIGDAAQGPGGDHRVDAAVVDWNVFCRRLDEFKRRRGSPRTITGHLQQLWRSIESDNLNNALPVKRQIQTRADPDFEYSTTGNRNEAAAIGLEAALTHRQVDQARDDVFFIKTHGTGSGLHSRAAITEISQHSHFVPRGDITAALAEVTKKTDVDASLLTLRRPPTRSSHSPHLTD